MATDPNDVELDDEDQPGYPAKQPTRMQAQGTIGPPITPQFKPAGVVTPPHLDTPTPPVQPSPDTIGPPIGGSTPEPTMGGASPDHLHGIKRVLDTIAGATNIGSAIERAGGFGTQGQKQQIEDAQGREANEAAIGEKNAETEHQKASAAEETAKGKAETAASGNVTVTGPDGVISIPEKDYAKYLESREGNKTKENVAGTAATSRENVAQTNADARAASTTERADEFRKTDQYRRWKEGLDNDTKRSIGAMSQNKAPAAVIQSAVFANGGISMMSDAERAMDDLESRGVLGNVPANKIENWLFEKGLVDPNLDAKTRREIGTLRSALEYTSSAAMRAHTGRTSSDIYKDFKTMLGPNQDLDALRGALEETHKILGDYSTAASDSSIQAIRQGQNPNQNAPATSPQGAGHQVGDEVSIKGKKMKVTAVHKDGSFDAQ